jgi:hypothetical protein
VLIDCLVLVRERDRSEIRIAEQPARAPRAPGLKHEAPGDDCGVLGRLVSGKVCEQSSVPKRDRVTIEHEHALASARQGDNLARAVTPVAVAAERAVVVRG